MFLLRSVLIWLTLLFVSIAALASLVVWSYVVPPLGGRLATQKLDDMSVNVALVASTIAPDIRTEPFVYAGMTHQRLTIDRPDQLATYLGDIGAKMNARVFLVKADTMGQIPYASERPGGFSAGDYPMLTAAVLSKHQERGTVTIAGEKFVVIAMPLTSAAYPNNAVAVVLIVAPLRDVETSVRAVKQQILQASALALVASLIVGFLASYFISRRIRRIEGGAVAMMNGDFAASVAVNIPDEIGRLGETFNAMGGKLSDAFSQIEYEKNRVELLLSDLSEGVIGISAEGRVTIANPASTALLGHHLSPGSELGQAFPYEVARMWYESRHAGGVATVAFVHGSRTLEASTYAVGSGSDFSSIVVVRDITAQAKLDRARRDFVANASHEFKTPLFSLSGFLELIAEGDLDKETQDEFLRLMAQQVDRLRDLSLSLLDLSRIEAGALELHASETDPGDLADSVVSEFQTQSLARSLTIVVDRKPGAGIIMCDEHRLAQVLRALLDNALKFSSDGGDILVTVDGDEQQATIAITDSGYGISAEELPHVFERFYRGSESRGRKTGTGLGLSIASELVELMGGGITAASTPGEGSTFTVSVPRTEGKIT